MNTMKNKDLIKLLQSFNAEDDVVFQSQYGFTAIEYNIASIIVKDEGKLILSDAVFKGTQCYDKP